jgi:hypothetical protein
VGGFDAVEFCLSRMESLEPHHGFGDFLDEAMVLLDNIV